MSTDNPSSLDQMFGAEPVATTPTVVPSPATPSPTPIDSPQQDMFPQAPAEGQVERQPPPQVPQVPLPELLETRHRAQAAEREAQFLREQLQQFIQAQRQPPPPPPQPIDPVLEPERAYAALLNQTRTELLNQSLNTSEMLARSTAGDAAVDAALDWARQTGRAADFVQRPNAYQALLAEYRKEQVARTVGTDLDAFKAKVRAEIMAEMQGQRPQAPQTLPPSLSSATRASNSPDVVPEASDFFKGMFTRRTQPQGR